MGKNLLTKRLFGSSLDRPDGSLGLRRLAALVAVLLVVGAAVIFLARNFIVYNSTYKGTAIEVSAKGNVALFTVDSGGRVVASYPPKMTVKKGDRALMRTDEIRGVVVVRLLDE